MSQISNIIQWNRCDALHQQQLLARPAVNAGDNIASKVSEILAQVKQRGDAALYEYNRKFDNTEVSTLAVSQQQFAAAQVRIAPPLKQAIAVAARNIEAFHRAQKLAGLDMETLPGVRCEQITRPITPVGLYIPGGSAPLFSTVLMLAIPAKLAGCGEVILCSPPPVADEIIYAAQLCAVDKLYCVGGAQAIAAMAFGTETIGRVAKIFGPGNAWVTEAKRQISQRHDGAAIDMPAGPSEVLVIADSNARPEFIAADLLSQAEHGPDSQVMLLTPDHQLAQQVASALEQQLLQLPRASTARQALSASRLIVADDLAQCVAISNQYAPEHLIIQTSNPRQLLAQINNAGSVFLGQWSPESAGDYASGTNHVLPTYGYTITHSSLGLADFQKRMTVQELSADGLRRLAPTLEILASAEQLIAHKNAVSVRIAALKEQP